MKRKIVLPDGSTLMMYETGIENLTRVEWIIDNCVIDSGDFNKSTLEEYEDRWEVFADEYFFTV